MSNSKDLNFDVIKEGWNIYKLSDNTIIKIKVVLMRLIVEGVDPLGDPLIQMGANTIIVSIPPSDLRKIRSIDEIIDMHYETIKADWNEYSIEDNSILTMKPLISQIDRSDKLDQRGEPQYKVSVQPSFKRIPKGKNK